MTVNFEQQKQALGSLIEKKTAQKKEYMTLRIREKEQRKMATLVAKQSQQMLQLLADKQEEIKQEMAHELVSFHYIQKAPKVQVNQFTIQICFLS